MFAKFDLLGGGRDAWDSKIETSNFVKLTFSSDLKLYVLK